MKKRDETNRQLVDLMAKNKIDLTEAAGLCLSPRETVRNWIRPPEKSNYRKMPTQALEIFKLKLKTRSKRK